MPIIPSPRFAIISFFFIASSLSPSIYHITDAFSRYAYATSLRSITPAISPYSYYAAASADTLIRRILPLYVTPYYATPLSSQAYGDAERRRLFSRHYRRDAEAGLRIFSMLDFSLFAVIIAGAEIALHDFISMAFVTPTYRITA